MIRTLVALIIFTLAILALLPAPSAVSVAQANGAESAICSDPRIAYSTFIGGELEENGNDIAVNADGHVYIGGTSYSNQFPARHGVDVVGLGLNADGSALENLYWVNPAQLNDKEDQGYATAIDAAGNRYVAGFTNSAEFCSTVSANPVSADSSYGGNTDGFLLKINASDGEIGYCTFVGGNELDLVYDIAVAPDGTAHIVGDTYSVGDFLGTDAADHAGARDLFVTSVTPDGSAFNTTTLLGGSGNDQGRSIALGADGSRYVTGWSFSADFITTTGALQPTSGGGSDSYVTKLDASGAVAYSTYLGGGDEDRSYAIDVDAAGRAHVVGGSKSADFPTSADAYDNSYAGAGFSGHDAYLTILSADGSSLSYSTFFGGANADYAYGIDLVDGAIYLAGRTSSPSFPLTPDALDSTLEGSNARDGWLMRFDTVTNAPAFSTLWGGADQDQINDVAVRDGFVYIVGESKSAELCTTPTAYDTTHNGDSDIFVVKLSATSLMNMKTYLPTVTRP